MIRPVALACAALCLAAGCFNEPEPAARTVSADARVYLNDRNLRDLAGLEDAFKAGAAIDYVNLDRNRLEVFPPELATLTGLKWLRLNDNRLSSLPELKSLVNLRRIYLRNNRFTSVPEALKDLPALTDIDLTGNPVMEVPAWLAQKRNLEFLSFTGTKIEKLPDDLTAWRSLLALQLGELRLSAEEMARIRAALPATAIVF